MSVQPGTTNRRVKRENEQHHTNHTHRKKKRTATTDYDAMHAEWNEQRGVKHPISKLCYPHFLQQMQRISNESGCELNADFEENIKIGNFHLVPIIGDDPAKLLKAQELIDELGFSVMEKKPSAVLEGLIDMRQSFFYQFPSWFRKDPNFYSHLSTIQLLSNASSDDFVRQSNLDNPPICWKGSEADLREAKKLCDELITKIAPKANTMTDKVIKKFFVDFDIVGKLIGYGGHNLQKLEEETATKIRIAKEIANSVKREVLIRGTEENIATAWQRILNPIEDSDYEEVYVPNQFRGRVIGSGGSNIKKLERETGATFRFELTRIDEIEMMRIRGSPEAMQKGKERLLKMISIFEMKEAEELQRSIERREKRRRDNEMDDFGRNEERHYQGDFQREHIREVIQNYERRLKEEEEHFGRGPVHLRDDSIPTQRLEVKKEVQGDGGRRDRKRSYGTVFVSYD